MRTRRLLTSPALGLLLPIAAVAALAPACGGETAATPPPASPTQSVPLAPQDGAPAPASGAAKHDAVDRATFNRVAARLNLPLYWSRDANGNGVMDPEETSALLFFPTSNDASWVTADKRAFTPAFEAAYAKVAAAAKGDADASGAGAGSDGARRKLVGQDLDQGRSTLVESDLSTLGDAEKELVRHVLKATDLIDDLYATQVGAKALASQVPADDAASQSLFRRDWGPRCLQPATEKNAACSAIPGAPKPLCDAYPAEIQKGGPAFCEALEKLPNNKALLDPFVVVRERGGKLEPVPFSEAYKAQMEPISKELKAAGESIKDAGEAAFKAYLMAASQSFLTNDWVPADEAWARMNATNSAWYLRIGADEVYWDPCNHKAGFHVTFARINKESLAWQAKLVPVEQEMEATLAKHIGKPYAERKVTFHLPDFVDIAWNAGDDRKPDGATIGQSLPNWGPVANEGRGRTVAMSNLYTDPDSIAARKDGAASLLSSDTMAVYDTAGTPGLLNTILHEATHNLGPAHEYKFNGKTDGQWFGGGLASMMEELKAQTGALYYLDFLRTKGVIDDALVKKTYTDSIVWSFGHVSRGMYTESGGRKAYSQLAAIQMGFLLDEGALAWDPNARAANGKDTGALTIRFEKMPAAVAKLMKVVGAMKAKGDRAGAEALAKKYVDGAVVPQKTISERWLRHPKSSFVYAVKL